MSEPDEPEPVVEWVSRLDASPEGYRTYMLYRAGYPRELAEEIGERKDIDLHDAIELVRPSRAGRVACDPILAAEILL